MLNSRSSQHTEEEDKVFPPTLETEKENAGNPPFKETHDLYLMFADIYPILLKDEDMVWVKTRNLATSQHLEELVQRPELIIPYSPEDYNKILYFDQFGVQIHD